MSICLYKYVGSAANGNVRLNLISIMIHISNDLKGCYYAEGTTIGKNSCNDVNACHKAAGEIGNNSWQV